MSLFLTLDELVNFTRYKSKRHQADWLKANGIQFYVAGDGTPQVPRAQFETGGERAPKERPPPKLNLAGLTPPSAIRRY